MTCIRNENQEKNIKQKHDETQTIVTLLCSIAEVNVLLAKKQSSLIVNPMIVNNSRTSSLLLSISICFNFSVLEGR